MSRSKLNTALASTALVVAVLGATPLGHAAGKPTRPGTRRVTPSAPEA